MKTVIYVVDRVEGDMAVLLDDEERILEIPTARLPAGAQEGAVLELDTGSSREHQRFRILHAETEARRARNRARARDLAADDPGGDIDLS